MTPRRRKFLSPEVLQEAAEQVQALAASEGLQAILIGGYAMQLYGSDRLTGDVDFAALSRITSLPEGQPLSFGGQKTTAPNGVPVDVVVRSDDYEALYQEAIHSAALDEETGLLVARPEYLAAMKMVAGRDRDDSDLEALILSGGLDLVQARKIIKKHLGTYAVDELGRAVDEANWKAEKGRR